MNEADALIKIAEAVRTVGIVLWSIALALCLILLFENVSGKGA